VETFYLKFTKYYCHLETVVKNKAKVVQEAENGTCQASTFRYCMGYSIYQRSFNVLLLNLSFIFEAKGDFCPW